MSRFNTSVIHETKIFRFVPTCIVTFPTKHYHISSDSETFGSRDCVLEVGLLMDFSFHIYFAYPG